VATGSRYEQEERHRGADGQYRWFLSRGVPLRDSEGRIVRWYGSNTDIEDRKEAEDRLRLVIDTLPALVWSKLPDGSADFLNQRFREYTGLSVEEGLGWGWMMKAFHPEDRAEEEWRAAFAAGQPFEKEARMRRADGAYRWFMHRAVPLHDELGNVVKWYGTTTDIEERKHTEAALQESQAALARVARIATMGELTASIAHEINQPLGAMVTNGSAALQWLTGQPPNLAEAREAVEEAIREANRASEVIGRIRALLQKAPPQMERMDVNVVVREVLTLAKHELVSSGVTVGMELDPDVPAVLGDRVQLRQVMLNLILNAIEAMSMMIDRGRKLFITSAKHSEGVLITVQDSGKGLDPEYSDRIFDTFFTTKPGGIGMGLSISRSIVEAHGGRLWASSESSQGAIFEFTLPAADMGDERVA
jgi:PAS domain S-box-containing protein